jgi:4-hydroxy-tetrahydrodipicolinate synthase
MHEVFRSLTGVIPPMITPFTDDGSIDEDALRAEAGFLLESGVDGLVVSGSTGEGAGLTEEEIHAAASVVVEVAGGRVPVLGGVIADTSEEAIRLGLAARRAGVAALQVPPPHFHLVTDPAVLSEYYRSITEATGLPLIIYNVIPWAQVAVESLEQLMAENPAICGVKQSGSNIHALADLLAHLRGRVRIYSAIDDLIFPSFMLGADGTISGTASLFPRETVEIYRAVQKGELERARGLHEAILPVWRTIQGELFPGKIKYAMSLLGRAAGQPRAPFRWPEGEEARKIEEGLRRSGFLDGRRAPETDGKPGR